MDLPTEPTSNRTDGNCESNNEKLEFKTPFPGLKESDFVRTSAKGNYCPVVHEIFKLVTQNKLTHNESRVLFYIAEKTIFFRDTHVKLRRKDIYQYLKIAKPKFYDAAKSLCEKQLLLEKHAEDDYYYYALDPRTLGGTIVLRSVHESAYRVNRNKKLSTGTLKLSTAGTKKLPQRYQKGTDWVTKRYPEDAQLVSNYSAFETLKYTLSKYTLLNGLSATKAEFISKLFEEVNRPDYMIQQLVQLMKKNPSSVRGIAEELIRAHTQQKDAMGWPIKTHALAYVIHSWDKVKDYWNNLDHKYPMDEKSTLLRQEAYDLIMDYPLENKVLPFRKAAK